MEFNSLIFQPFLWLRASLYSLHISSTSSPYTSHDMAPFHKKDISGICREHWPLSTREHTKHNQKQLSFQLFIITSWNLQSIPCSLFFSFSLFFSLFFTYCMKPRILPWTHFSSLAHYLHALSIIISTLNASPLSCLLWFPGCHSLSLCMSLFMSVSKNLCLPNILFPFSLGYLPSTPFLLLLLLLFF